MSMPTRFPHVVRNPRVIPVGVDHRVVVLTGGNIVVESTDGTDATGGLRWRQVGTSGDSTIRALAEALVEATEKSHE